MKPILAAVVAVLPVGQPSIRSAFRFRHLTRSASSRTYHASSHSTWSYSGVPEDRHGHIKRSETAKRDFMRQTGFPHGRPGYVWITSTLSPAAEPDDPSIILQGIRCHSDRRRPFPSSTGE
jgi:hypothetical protein